MGDITRVQIAPVITGPDAPVKGERPPSTPQGTRPDYLPEKFWKDGKPDYEGLAKSYAELEKNRTKPASELPVPPKPEEKPKEEQPPKPEEKPKEEQPQGDVISIPGVTPEQATKYQTELAQGNLSEASYGELAKAGYPKVMVSAYIRGLQAEQAEGVAQATEMKKIAGGEAEYATMTEWMANNLPPEEVADYNKAVSSGNKFVMKAAVEAAHQRFVKANGTAPNLLGGHGNTQPSGDVFRSQSEITAAMRDPRYKKDAGYRSDVLEKIKRSEF